MPVYLGLDCGGSSCRAMAIDESGAVVFRGQGGSANVATTPEPILRRSLERALEGLPKVDRLFGCFAGMIDEAGRARATAILTSLVPDVPVSVEADYAAAFRSCPDGTVACVIAGTGSIVCSRVEGRLVKSGGGGYLLGDEGSGFRYGLSALKHFIQEPQAASEAMLAAIADVMGTIDPAEATSRVYQTPRPAALLSRLTGALVVDAGAGLAYARSAIARESGELAHQVMRHLERYHPEVDSPQVGIVGGVWRHPEIREAFSNAMPPELTIVRPQIPPVHGAALLAREAA